MDTSQSMPKPRYLTKTRFKIGMECPTKLFYTGKKKYPNQKMDDSFLEALADGGFQVGELAKLYHPGGHDITTLDYEEAEKITNDLLTQENVIIYEPAIRFGNLFIRIDVLIKEGKNLSLIEVKAKSFDSRKFDPFNKKDGSVNSEWKPYLYDVAFQTHVLNGAMPACIVTPYLMLADKRSVCATNQLNQKFRITKDGNRKGINVSNTLNENDLKSPLLIKVPVHEQVNQIFADTGFAGYADIGFQDIIQVLSGSYEHDEKIRTSIGAKCGSCEFQCTQEEETQDHLKNGFKECWRKELNWTDNDFEESNVLEIWNYRGKSALIEQRRIKFSSLEEEDFNVHSDKNPGLSSSERQWMQVQKVIDNDNTPYIAEKELRDEMDAWVFPLHFIDFETSAMAIPFNQGRRPYEGIAFQFSHHVIYENGKIEHMGEYISTQSGVFPNYDFVRALQEQLTQDQGTIFRYSNHENTYLNMIYRQLKEDDSPPEDIDVLCGFIKTITKSVNNSKDKWHGDRCMVDQWELVKRFYYDPCTHGSNSIKQVLPAILNSSKYLQKKYSQRIYGAVNGIKSLNYKNWKWIQKDALGHIIDPYKLLPKMFQDVSDANYDRISEDDEIRDGGAALVAYAQLQFVEMSDEEKEEIRKALLMYCELDTFAMVMLYEGLKNFV